MGILILQENCEKWKLVLTFRYADMIEQSMCLHLISIYVTAGVTL